jgi:hypothetical protein
MKLTTNSIPPTIFLSTCTNQEMESPFTAHNISSLSTPLQGFQHRLDNNSTCWDLGNSTVATLIFLETKHVLHSTNFKQNFTHGPTTSFSMKFQLQTFSKCAHNSYLQASTLRTPLLARKLHVKQLSMKKRECIILVSLPIQISLLSLASLTCTFPQADCTHPPCSQ